MALHAWVVSFVVLLFLQVGASRRAARTSNSEDLRMVGPHHRHDKVESPKAECATHDVDNYQPPSDSTCYVRQYWCSGHSNVGYRPVNHNTGDVGWALSAECSKYGDNLHVYRIEVARPSMENGLHRYSQCNAGVCGCGLHGDKCASSENHSNAFGWREKKADGKQKRFACRQFSLPAKAQGRIDSVKAQEFIDNKSYRDKTHQGDFQWNPVCLEHVVSAEKCLKPNVWDKNPKTAEEAAALFNTAVLGDRGKRAAGCKTAGMHFLWMGWCAPFG